MLAQIDGDVARFKTPPRETPLRRSSEQVDELVTAYRAVRPPPPADLDRRRMAARVGTTAVRSRAGAVAQV